MKRLFLYFLFFVSVHFCSAQQKRTIFISGGDFGKPFLRKVIALTGKANPKICFLPTASGDDPSRINAWYAACEDLPMRPYVQKVFLNSSPEQKTFEENLLDMDAIVVGGGSTLNMIAIWKAQGIDTVLIKAYRKGIILAGGSAGALCWFKGGVSDSRPKALSLVECLGLIPASNCPHYHTGALRRPLYLDAIRTGKLVAGYACDDKAGILFENEKYVLSCAADTADHTYYVAATAGKISEKMLPVTEILK